MLPKKIWLLLDKEEGIVGISFDELPHTPIHSIRRAVRYDLHRSLDQLELPIASAEVDRPAA